MTESAATPGTTGPGRDDDFDEELRGFVQRTELRDIRYTKWSAELFSDEHDDIREIELLITLSYRLKEGGFDCRFDVAAPLSTKDDEDVANIELAVMAAFSVDGDGDGEPRRELVSAFMKKVGFFVVMPFVREGLHSLSTRIGLEPITIGLLQEGDSTPVRAWIKKPGDEDSRR